jgi:hypothetical protein
METGFCEEQRRRWGNFVFVNDYGGRLSRGLRSCRFKDTGRLVRGWGCHEPRGGAGGGWAGVLASIRVKELYPAADVVCVDSRLDGGLLASVRVAGSVILYVEALA